MRRPSRTAIAVGALAHLALGTACGSPSGPPPAGSGPFGSADAGAGENDAGQGAAKDSGAGTDGGGASGDAAAFLGAWERAGENLSTCSPTLGLFPAPMNGNITITAGPTAGSLVATQPGGCKQTLQVSGDHATVTPGQACTTTSDGGVQTVDTVVSDVLTVNATGQMLTEVGSFSLVETSPGGSRIDCTQTAKGLYTKQ